MTEPANSKKQNDVKKQDNKERTGLKERRSYVILAIIILLLFGASDSLMINYVNGSNKAFCELLQAITPTSPPPKPVNPKLDPTGQKRYDDYFIVLRLDHRLGCD